ncbi:MULTISPECIES: hypothetical protein [Bacillus]|uniref:DUF3278 domain-containing protein n=2 Tax=Bacillus TaxID=1386 RepID=A0A0M4FUR0_9BACI|nr:MULTISPECIES: hypothetical protein [Bacillus]ALC80263.1 hypothetical protein AM592_00595 [Bacillus gobiensis]MBP1083910.1 putative membrane protein [Bacillus capparidis]MED1098388.1 DUF3278 domain-containing protein [Bacillus capparidis]
MKKSWISILLPNDEYKKQKMVYFFAESSLVLLVVLIILFGLVQMFPSWDLGTDHVIGICIITFLLYVGGRYTFSGIEFTEIATEKAFQREKKLIIFKSISFVVIFLVLYLLFYRIPGTREILFVLLSGFFMFLSSYISLKRSYNKNKEILED